MNKRAALVKLYRHLHSSYWVIPTLFLITAVFLAAVTIALDRVFPGVTLLHPSVLLKMQPDTARVLLSTIAGSVIGVAGVVFSITMVAVSYASGTFGPRLIGNFMRDRGNQVSLGIFIGTFIFALLVLRTVQTGDASQGLETFVPGISIAVSLILVLLCMATLIYFIHHVPEAINIERIIANLGKALKSGVDARFPDQSAMHKRLLAEKEDWWHDQSTEDAVEIALETEGYIQALDIGAMERLARRHDLHIQILKRPGAFVTVHTGVMAVWPKDSADRAVMAGLRECIATGATPTVNQNVEFVADQLVEIIARALSPGMNDPFTAISCINWLHAGVLHFATHEKITERMSESDRIEIQPTRFRGFVEAIFDKARPYISSDANVARHTLSTLAEIAEQLPQGNNRDVIEEQRGHLERAAAHLEGIVG